MTAHGVWYACGLPAAAPPDMWWIGMAASTWQSGSDATTSHQPVMVCAPAGHQETPLKHHSRLPPDGPSLLQAGIQLPRTHCNQALP